MSETKPKINRRSLMIVGVIFLCVFIAGSAWWWLRLGRIVSTDDARVKGTMTTLSAKVPGHIEKILVEEGAAVEAGQPLAVLKRQEYENKVSQAKAKLAMAKAKLEETRVGNRPQEIMQAKAKLSQQKSVYDNSRKNYERYQSLYNNQAISEQQLDSARTEMESALMQYQAAEEAYSLSQEGSRTETIALNEAGVEQAQAELENAEIELEDTVIKAPAQGIVGKKSIELGEFVSAGKPLFNITDLESVWISANIEETAFGKIALGNPVEFTIDAYPGVSFSGEVFETSPATGAQFSLLSTENSAGNFTKVTQRLPIKIRPSASNYVLKPGMSAIINIHVKP